MTTQKRRPRRPWQPLSVLLGCCALSAYFAHHAVYGKHGLEAQSRLIERAAGLERSIGSLGTVHAGLKRHVGLLVAEPPARDIVEEVAQRDLGFAYPGDMLVKGFR